MWSFSRSKRGDRPAKGCWVPIGEEVEAFVHGHLGASRGIETGGAPWLQLNRLAHGSLDDIRALADPQRDLDATRDRGDDPWAHLLARLSVELLELGDDAVSLRTVQSCALWPLESEMIAAEEQLVPTPGELYRLVRGALTAVSDPSTAEGDESGS